MTTLQLKELSHSGLYRRRRDRPHSLGLQELPEQKLSVLGKRLLSYSLDWPQSLHTVEEIALSDMTGCHASSRSSSYAVFGHS
ncbi:putative LIM domain-containing protein [Naja naja]|nr:putative LIM domain-containing protein [Naja naja]